jgi:hypothetical protein
MVAVILWKGAPRRGERAEETLPGSTLPDELIALGYDVREDGEGERIIANAITQLLTLTSSGSFEAATAGIDEADRDHGHACRDRARAAICLCYYRTIARVVLPQT